MDDVMDKVIGTKKLMETSSLLSFPLSMAAYVTEVGLGGLLLRDTTLPTLVKYCWGSFEGLVFTVLFLRAVNIVSEFFTKLYFPAVVGAILISFGIFAIVPKDTANYPLINNHLWYYAALVMGIMLYKDTYESKSKKKRD